MNKYDSMTFDELRALMVERGILESKIEGEGNARRLR
jgi:hypothetical protein